MSTYLNLAGTAVLILAALQSSAMHAEEARGPLAGLPSEVGAHVDRIQALGDKAWLDLGPPAADEQWGRARGRSWTAVMPLASRLRGAFLFGEGQHVYAKPNGHYMDDLWFYDCGKNSWKPAHAEGPPPPFGIDAVSCYDPKRERIYIGGRSYPVAPQDGHAFWVYDLKQNCWVDPQPEGKLVDGSNSFPTKNAVLVYDSVNDKVLLVFHSFHDDQPERLGIDVYDPERNAWAEQRMTVPKDLGHNRHAKNGFYDPDLGVVFIHTAGDSRDDGRVWVYRHEANRHTQGER